MGLDMYLFRHKKSDINKEKLDMVAYWRKSNQIHNWFVENVQNNVDDCGCYSVTKTQLERLLDTCKIINSLNVSYEEQLVEIGTNYTDGKAEPIMDFVRTIDNEEIIMQMKQLLPTSSGFFFGSTDYDEYYMYDIEDTIEQLTKVLEETNFEEEDIFYHSSW